MSTPGRVTADPTVWSSALDTGLAGSFLTLLHAPPDTEKLTGAEVGAEVGAAIYGTPWGA